MEAIRATECSRPCADDLVQERSVQDRLLPLPLPLCTSPSSKSSTAARIAARRQSRSSARTSPRADGGRQASSLLLADFERPKADLETIATERQLREERLLKGLERLTSTPHVPASASGRRTFALEAPLCSQACRPASHSTDNSVLTLFGVPWIAAGRTERRGFSPFSFSSGSPFSRCQAEPTV